MKKSVYSLMLDDAVVAEIDKLAYRRGTNRSGLVNQILAEYVSYVTPEKRMEQIFDRMTDILSDVGSFLLPTQPSETLYSLRSALAFKYNPTVKYSVELYRNAANEIGELRVGLRTQNAILCRYLNAFYRVWISVEQEAFGSVASEIDGEKLTRRLVLRPTGGNSGNDDAPITVGDAISAYIRYFDNALKAYFAYIETPSEAIHAVRQIYGDYLRKVPVAL